MFTQTHLAHSSIATSGTNGMVFHNHIIYNTYRSGIVVTGRNNQITRNLVTTVYWSGSGQSESIAEVNLNYDAAIMTRSAISVVMQVRPFPSVEAFRSMENLCGALVNRITWLPELNVSVIGSMVLPALEPPMYRVFRMIFRTTKFIQRCRVSTFGLKIGGSRLIEVCSI